MKKGSSNSNGIKQTEELTMRSLMENVLSKLNLSFNPEADNEIFVQYQGEWFRILFLAEESHCVEIQDNYWYAFPLYDIDNLSMAHKAINQYNINGRYRMCYSYRKDENEVSVHTCHEALWIPQIPELDKYLLSIFNGMLESHHRLFNLMEDIRREKYNEKTK